MALTNPFTTAEARLHGIDKRQLAELVRDGRLLRLGRGLYADRELWESWWPSQRAAAAAATAARVVPGAIASHCSGSLLRELPSARLPVFPVHATTLDDRTTPDTAWYKLHRGWLPADHIEVIDGILVTTATRTIVDTIRQVSRKDGQAIADAAVRHGHTTPNELLVMRRLQTRWQHVSKVDDVLRLIDGRRESWLESASAVTFDIGGLPQPIPQVEVFDADGTFVGRLDAYWEVGVGGEADGRAKTTVDEHGRPLPEEEIARRLEAAENREVGLRGAGVELFRWTTDESAVTDVIVRRHRRAVEAAEDDPRHPIVRCACCHADLDLCRTQRDIDAFRARLRP